MIDNGGNSWDFLRNSYWYVPAPNLRALQYVSGSNALEWEQDQTVWHISGYDGGYFWGVSSVALISQGTASPPRQLTFVGTVTPEGQVQISFIQNGLLRDSVTTGLGQMIRLNNQWAFQMHMATASASGQLLHWANMLQTREGEESWRQLPGTNLSVPAMLEGAAYPKEARTR